jgi:hypothetical protein
MTPVPPRSKSPLTQLMTSPRTCMAMITTASLHPQRRHRNHPIPTVVRAAPSSKKRIPTVPPKAPTAWTILGVRLCLHFATECGLELPWRKHYSVLDFLTNCAFIGSNPKNKRTPSRLPVVRKPSRISGIGRLHNFLALVSYSPI